MAINTLRFNLLCCCIFLNVLGTGYLRGQASVSGQVFNSADGKPVPFATVYVNNTTRGTITDTLGNFMISNVFLPCEIVVSHISFQSNNVSLPSDSLLPLDIQLQKDHKNIKEVFILDDDLRQRNIQLFHDLVIGKDKWGKKADFLNPDDLWFDLIINEGDSMPRSNRINQFKAYAIKPLQIKLPHFGYNLQFDLVAFKLYYEASLDKVIYTYKGYFYYQPDGNDRWILRNRIRNNRLKAYYSSPRHFFRSLYTDSLTENGYAVYDGFFHNYKYFNDDSLFSFDPYIKHLPDNQLQVSGLLGKVLYIEYYSASSKRPQDLNVNRPIYPTRSRMMIASDLFHIRANGTSGNANVVFTGALGGKQLGAALPSDYWPDY